MFARNSRWVPLIYSNGSLFLFYFILFYFILFYFILFYFILFYSILFYSILFYSILSDFILFYFILFYFILFYLSFLFDFTLTFFALVRLIKNWACDHPQNGPSNTMAAITILLVKDVFLQILPIASTWKWIQIFSKFLFQMYSYCFTKVTFVSVLLPRERQIYYN